PEPTPAAEPPPPPTTPTSPPPASSPTLDALTTAEHDPGRPFDLHWHLLNLPGYVLEIAVLPLQFAVELTERYRLDRRVADVFEIAGGAVKISPRVKLAFGDGLGIGAKLKFPRLLERRAALAVGGLYRLDGDWLIDGSYVQRLGSVERRTLRLRAGAERDANERYYGIGGGSRELDRRALRNDDQGLFLGFDVFASDSYDWSGVLELGAYRQSLAGGSDAAHPPVGGPDDMIEVPPGFDDAAVFAHLALAMRYDTRDTKGRPTKGSLIDLGLIGRSDGGGLSGALVSATARWFAPVLRDARVLVLTLGGSAALPLFRDSTIPLSMLSTLGREHFLRGYDRARFRDRYALWTSLEYRYPIYEYLTTGAGLDAFLFTDAATAFGVDALTAERLRYSAGGGLRGAHETVLVFELTVGYSPEGLQIFFGAERPL
ncbi:MAG: BamA/TamA family outer membrane protein, partial [Deltaproteobacteria bacterium]|nr:BamA/TamA family outer membrane protein [Deltaproteobacteria bacterium]